jgi:hypothetical protein
MLCSLLFLSFNDSMAPGAASVNEGLFLLPLFLFCKEKSGGKRETQE